MCKDNKYPEEVTLKAKYHCFKVYTVDSEDVITFDKAKLLSEVMALLSKKVVGIIGIK